VVRLVGDKKQSLTPVLVCIRRARESGRESSHPRPSSVCGSVPGGTFHSNNPPEAPDRCSPGGFGHFIFLQNDSPLDNKNGFLRVKHRTLINAPLRIRFCVFNLRRRESGHFLRSLPFSANNLRSGSGTSIVVTGSFQDGMEWRRLRSLKIQTHYLS
jgi:hypothetical protein